MSSSSFPAWRPRPVPRRRRWLLWVAVVCVAAVLVEVGLVTDGFGLGPLLAPKKGGSGPSGPNLNPFGENVTGLVGAVSYSGSSSPFPDMNGVNNLCSACPARPTTNTNVSPPVAQVWVYFSITSAASVYTTLTDFALTTSGSNASLFSLLGVFLANNPSESITQLGFTPGQTWSLAINAVAPSIPYSPTGGFTLTLDATNP